MYNSEKSGLSIVIGADVLPTPSNYELFSQGNVTELLGDDLCGILEKADFRVFNLEGPLTEEKHPILKNGPVLNAPESTIAGLAAMKTDLLALSNNHIRDHGSFGIQQSIKLAESSGIAYMGIGLNREERSKPYFFRKNGICIGFYNCCEHEESVTLDGEYGANPYDALNSFDDVQKAKCECDFLIVLYHGGKERFRYPSPMLMRRFRKFAEKGADIVIAQHTHCIGSYEKYNGSLLLYGQGNFIFDRADNEFYDTGLLLEITFGTGGDNDYQYKFIPVQKHKNVVRLADADEKKSILSSLEDRSLKLQDENFIKEEYLKKADEYIVDYLFTIKGHLWIGKAVKKIFKGKLNKYLIRCMYSPRLTAYIKNYIACEAHQELLLTGLDNVINERWRQG